LIFKKNNFMKIKFHLNENIEKHCMQLELNVNSKKFNQFKFNWILIWLNSIEPGEVRFNCKKLDAYWWKRYWKFVHEYDVEKKRKFKKTYLKSTLSCLFMWGWVKQILVWNCSNDNLPKLTTMNHHHWNNY
jgi:hypothetical protein